MNRRAFIRSVAVSTAVAGASFASDRAWPISLHRRPFAWRDAANRVEVEQLAISDDGGTFALQVARPLSGGGEFLGQSRPGSVDTRGDLWLLDEALGVPARLDLGTRGAWSPCFSPDGRRLCALTLVSPGKVGLVIWELASGKYRILSDPNVQILSAAFRTTRSAYAAPSGFFQAARQYLWLNDASILYVDHGSAPQQYLLATSSLSSTLEAFRRRTEEGKPSVRVWSDHSPTCGAGSRLVRIACDSGEIETLYEGDVRGVSLSGDRRWLAVVVATGNVRPIPNKAMRWGIVAALDEDPMVTLKLALIDLTKPGTAQDIEGVTTVGGVRPSRLPQWSADSKRVALPVRTSYSDAQSTGSDAVWEASASTGQARRWPALSPLDAELLAALITTEGLNAKTAIEYRTQKIRPEDFSGLGPIKGGAWRCASQQVMFWNAPVLTLIAPTHITTLPGHFTSVQPPARDESVARTLAVKAEGGTSIITTYRDSYRIENVPTRPAWNLLGVRPRDAAVVYKDDADTGTFLILAKPGDGPRKSPLTFNTYFRDVLTPERRMLALNFPDGTVRQGVLVLPIGHTMGDRHPVIVWAYPNSVPSINDNYTQINNYISTIYPIQHLLAKGFAFFQAPFPISGESSLQPMRAAVDAVLPWLDVLDHQPEIIPGDYGFFGHSNAGYVALALEALTHRFKAIVAWDTFPEIGYDTLHSWSGDVAQNCAGNVIQSDRAFYEDPSQPYTPEPAPPWKEPRKYIRNDPLFSLNGASTPLLLVEGEFDVDPREMEEVYSILFGNGVPVDLALYWGEAHVFASPGNIQDSWLRTEKFFKRHLRMR